MKVKCVISEIDSVLKIGEWYDVIGVERYFNKTPHIYYLRIDEREYNFKANKFETIEQQRDRILENILNNE